MVVNKPADPRGLDFPFAQYSIGDPGRAAIELPAGIPGPRSGHADVEISIASMPGMAIIGATSRGLQHRATGTPRQDAFALGRAEVGDVEEAIAVVCDGVGSLGQSDVASVLVSRRLADLGAAATPWPEAFACVNKELQEMAREFLAKGDGDPVGYGMATTAVAVVVRRVADEWVGTAAWVGDSTLWHLTADAQWVLVTGVPDPGVDAEFHSSSVQPLPSDDGAYSILDFRLGGGGLFVMSDGVANPLKWSPAVQETLARWWMRPPDPYTFAAQVGFARKSHIDDRTVVGIWCAESEGKNTAPHVGPSPADRGGGAT
jgi:Protein phosphatase 2C